MNFYSEVVFMVFKGRPDKYITFEKFIYFSDDCMEEAFMNCMNLECLDLSMFDFSEVRSMENCFKNCMRLKYLRLPKTFRPEEVECYGMFIGCISLKAVDLGNLRISVANLLPANHLDYIEGSGIYPYCNGIKMIPPALDNFTAITQFMDKYTDKVIIAETELECKLRCTAQALSKPCMGLYANNAEAFRKSRNRLYEVLGKGHK